MLLIDLFITLLIISQSFEAIGGINRFWLCSSVPPFKVLHFFFFLQSLQYFGTMELCSSHQGLNSMIAGSYGLRNEFQPSVVNEPSVSQPSKFYCNCHFCICKFCIIYIWQVSTCTGKSKDSVQFTPVLDLEVNVKEHSCHHLHRSLQKLILSRPFDGFN